MSLALAHIACLSPVAGIHAVRAGADTANDQCLTVAWEQVTNIGCGVAHKVLHSQCNGQSNQLFAAWQGQPKETQEQGIMLTARFYAPGQELCMTTNSVGNVYMTDCGCQTPADRNKWSSPHLEHVLADHDHHDHHHWEVKE